jgi:hypothetical protein
VSDPATRAAIITSVLMREIGGAPSWHAHVADEILKALDVSAPNDPQA